MIGDAWLSAKEKTGERRLDNAGDFVRIEIESALARKIPVIPILVGHAPMPTADDLPEGLRELAFRNGQAVRADPDFHHDVERLVRGITDVVGVAPKPKVVSLMPKDAKSGSVADLENTRTFLQKNVLNPAGETGRGHKSGAVPKVTPVAAPVTPHRPSRSVSPKLEPTAEETRPRAAVPTTALGGRRSRLLGLGVGRSVAGDPPVGQVPYRSHAPDRGPSRG